METIKRIILWIIDFFRRLFGKKPKKKSKVVHNKNIDKVNKNKAKMVLPTYMIISDADKALLIDSIYDVKKRINTESIAKREITKIIALLASCGIATNEIEDYLNKQDLNKVDNKKIDILLGECDIKIKEKVNGIITAYQEDSKLIKETIHGLDEVVKYVKTNDISFETKELIDNEISKISVDKKQTIDKTPLFDKEIFDRIKDWDKNIVHEVQLEYQKMNYVTISNVLIDQIITKYQKLEDDYTHYRYNKSYYEREIGKIKNQIEYLSKIKNNKTVYEEIIRLRKELYTKSKDKYDILYNSEIFMSMNKKCDELLNKVNQKVVDIKKKESKIKKEENKETEEEKKEEYLKKVILRFQDLNLSRRLILLHKEKESEISKYTNIKEYLDQVYSEFIIGINENFNYQRNKTKTELVKLYNDLNNIIAHKKKEDHITIDHINFRMDDLVEAVTVRKGEVEREIDDSHKSFNSELVDEKMSQIREKFIEKKHEKVLKKTN